MQWYHCVPRDSSSRCGAQAIHWVVADPTAWSVVEVNGAVPPCRVQGGGPSQNFSCKLGAKQQRCGTGCGHMCSVALHMCRQYVAGGGMTWVVVAWICSALATGRRSQW